MTIADLNISDAEITSLQEVLETVGHPDAITTTITEQAQRVEDYSSRYAVPTGTKTRLTRVLVLYELYTLAGQQSASRKEAFDLAIQELRDIRDGKMYLAAVDTTYPAPAGKWGSETRYQDEED
jgi:hypothetical protein